MGPSCVALHSGTDMGGKLNDRPFPSFKNSHFQNEAKCKTLVVKMSFDA